MAFETDLGLSIIGKEHKKASIPIHLIKEIIDGIPFYYRGFRAVLNETKTKADIMADSGLQGYIKTFFILLLAKQLDLSKYHFFAGETGAHLDKSNNLSLDISIFDKSILSPDKITTRYLNVPPKIVIEIDVNVEVVTPNENIFDTFILRKIKKLHKFGTEKIIWVFSKSKTIIISTADKKWDVIDWDETVEILDGIQFNLAQYLKEQGVNVGE